MMTPHEVPSLCMEGSGACMTVKASAVTAAGDGGGAITASV